MVYQKLFKRLCMVKRLFFYITFITFLILILFIFTLFYLGDAYSGKMVNDISVSKYEDEYKVNFKYIHLIENIIKNKKKQLFDHYTNIKEEEILGYINSINSLLPVIKDEKSLTKYLATMPITIKIVNQKNIITVSNDILSLKKRIKLPCNPLNNGYGVCNKIIDKTLYTVMYNYKTDSYVMGEIEVNPLKSKELKLSLYNFIKIIPNIIIYKDKKDLVKLTKKNFYIMKYEDFLDLFYGIKINSDKIKKFADIVVKKLKKYKASLFYSIFILIIFLTIITSIFYWFFYKKIKIADKLYEEYSTNAKYDKLTKTLNRYAFENEFKISSYLRLSLLDLDNLKYINDNFGHNMGDEILKEFVSLVKKYFEDCILGRWGGDEFVMLTSYAKDEMISALIQINNSLLEFQKSFDKDLKKIVSTSIGSVKIDSHKEFEELFKKADLALYKVKKSHKGDIVFYEEIEYIRIEKGDL